MIKGTSVGERATKSNTVLGLGVAHSSQLPRIEESRSGGGRSRSKTWVKSSRSNCALSIPHPTVGSRVGG